MSLLRIGTVTFDWYPFDPTTRRLAESAIEAGHEVDVICLRQPAEKRHEVFNGVHIYRMPMNRSFATSHSLPMTLLGWCWFLLMAGATLTRFHLKRAYDVIHVHNMPDFLVFSTLLPKLLGAKVILEVQDVTPELMGAKAAGRKKNITVRLARWQERISTAFADHVITVGWPFEQLLLKRGVPAGKMTIILNSADPNLFPATRRTEIYTQDFTETRPFILMYHGTLAERNGLDVAMRAFALARQEAPHIRFDIKGRGEYIPVLKRLAQDLGIGEHVVFSDPCLAEEIVDFVTHGDVGIIPYRNDGFMELILPTKAYEFAWMHCPMIASDTRAIRSMFRPESVILCNASEPESFARAIIDMYQHPEKRASMVAHADEDYMPYRWEAMAERYRSLLTSLVQKEVQRESLPVGSNK